jgi:glutamate-5-semialdehyde dehydrogenase
MSFSENEIIEQLALTRGASTSLALATSEKKNEVLFFLAQLLLENSAVIIAENLKDLASISDDDPMRDRLLLNSDRIINLSKSVVEIAKLKDPTGQILTDKLIANGLKLTKISVPLGVVGVIFESRPNVTVDVAALCIRSGNAAVLRGGSDAWHSNVILVQLIHQALVSAGLSPDLVRLLPTDRKHVSTLLNAVKYVDVIIPRGSEALIQRVRRESMVPTIETGAGVCHTYVAQTADIAMAVSVVVNAKVSRPSVCNSLDTILLHESIAHYFLTKSVRELVEYKVMIYADAISFIVLADLNYPYLQKAEESDFGREFLDFACSIRVVQNLNEALSHIDNFSSRHSEAIISADESEANLFLASVDAAAVYWNASTRFTDGGIFELGAEVGISTQKLHARGPFGLEKLVTEKWVIKGNGQIR